MQCSNDWCRFVDFFGDASVNKDKEVRRSLDNMLVFFARLGATVAEEAFWCSARWTAWLAWTAANHIVHSTRARGQKQPRLPRKKLGAKEKRSRRRASV